MNKIDVPTLFKQAAFYWDEDIPKDRSFAQEVTTVFFQRVQADPRVRYGIVPAPICRIAWLGSQFICSHEDGVTTEISSIHCPATGALEDVSLLLEFWEAKIEGIKRKAPEGAVIFAGFYFPWLLRRTNVWYSRVAVVTSPPGIIKTGSNFV